MKVVDLTFGIKKGMPRFKASWHPAVEVVKLGRHRVEGRETRKVVLGTHTGTHIDAPLHFIKKGKAIDRLPLQLMAGKASVIDLSALKRPFITAGDLERKCDVRKLGRGRRILIYTGWSRRWGKKDYYKGYPFLTPDACRWILNKDIRLLGLDTPSPDNPAHSRGKRIDSPIHKRLLKKGVVLIEYLNNLDKVANKKVTLIALPLKLVGCDGSPARVIGIVK